MYTLITNDVEEVSIVNNSLNPETAKKVAEVGIPSLLDLYSKYNVEATFYFTATFAKRFPECVVNVSKQGHEVGCHGYSHLPEHAFDSLSPEKQYMHLYNAKRVIEKISGPIESFRAPALRINEYTPKALEYVGFKTDSSVASQRFDGPLSYGTRMKFNWLSSPRGPYTPSKEHGIRYNDLSFNFEWPREPLFISEKDKNHPDYQGS